MNRIELTHLKVEPTTPTSTPSPIPAPVAGHKRHYNDIHTHTNRTNIPSNSFAAHLPPLNKKIKLNANTNTYNYPHIQLQPAPVAAPHAAATSDNLFNNNLNITLDLDTLISHVANLRNINLNQIHLLNNLILATANNAHLNTYTSAPHTCTATVSQTPTNNIQNTAKNTNLSEYKSCHQCKTKKDVKILFYCTKTRPCSNNTFKKKTCRKKYCKSCMNKYYMEADVAQLQNMKDCAQWKWDCPACVGVCSCRACKRKRSQISDASHIEPTIAKKHKNEVHKQVNYNENQVQFGVNLQANAVNPQLINPPTFNHNGNTNELLRFVWKNSNTNLQNLQLLFR